MKKFEIKPSLSKRKTKKERIDEIDNEIQKLQQEKSKLETLKCHRCHRDREPEELKWFEPEGYGYPYCKNTCYDKVVEEHNEFMERFWEDVYERSDGSY